MYDKPIQQIYEQLKKLETDKLDGWTSGFNVLDKHVGRMQGGQIWVIGGYNATGKSYFILNMIEGIMLEWKQNKNKDYMPPKVAIFSTELSRKDYIYRHILMRMLLYPLQVQKYKHSLIENVKEEVEKYYDERLLNPDSLKIYGNVYDFSQIEKEINRIKDSVNIVFIDYIQELSVKNKYDEKDTMPILARKFKQLAGKYNICIVLVSQMNIYSMGKDYNVSQSQVPAFSFGKHLNSTAHVSIVLTREKTDGQLQKVLNVNIMKARGGTLGVAQFDILDGYKLKYVEPR